MVNTAGGAWASCSQAVDTSFAATATKLPIPANLRLATTTFCAAPTSLRIELGGEPGAANWIGPRPKGMHQRTYECTVDEITCCEYQSILLFLSKYRHVLSEALGEAGDSSTDNNQVLEGFKSHLTIAGTNIPCAIVMAPMVSPEC